MSLEIIEKWLFEKTGVLSERVGLEQIKQAVLSRMAENECLSIDEYIVLLTSSEGEYDAFIAKVMVSETWFFRDEVPYHFLSEVVKQWMKVESSPCHILSIPCSSGEEPYSIAITLSALGMDKRKYVVDAMDINREIIEKARKGVYRIHSFRGKDKKFMGLYFKKKEEEYHLDNAIKDRVNFSIGNVLDLDNICAGRFYDIIFCRNLLIYYDQKTQFQVLKKIHHRLRKNGILFAGHAEANSTLNKYFISVGPLGAFAFTKRKITPDQASDNIEKNFFLKKKHESNKLKIKNKDAHSSVHRKDGSDNHSIAELALKIEKIANNGDLEEASRLCQIVLSDSMDPEIYYICGLVMEAKREPHSAEALFRMALTLDPEHYNVLTHLAANLQARGLHSSAKKIKKLITHQLKGTVDDLE